MHKVQGRFSGWCRAALGGILVVALGAGLLAWNARPHVAALPVVALNGQPSSLGNWDAPVTVVEFWSTTCEACLQHWPETVAHANVWNDQKVPLMVIAWPSDTDASIHAWVDAHGSPGVLVHDDGRLNPAWNQTGVTPTWLVVGHGGVLLKRYVGVPPWDEMQAVIDHERRSSSASA